MLDLRLELHTLLALLFAWVQLTNPKVDRCKHVPQSCSAHTGSNACEVPTGQSSRQTLLPYRSLHVVQQLLPIRRKIDSPQLHF
eukprot:4650108-Amphidinium_carterae.1